VAQSRYQSIDDTIVQLFISQVSVLIARVERIQSECSQPDWQPLSVVDGRLITGQNPASSAVAAQNLVNLLAAEKAA